MPLPRLFVIGSSATLLMDPHLRAMTKGTFDYSRKGDEPSQMNEATADLDKPRGASGGDSGMIVAYLRSLEQSNFRADRVLLQCGGHDIKRNPKTGRNQVPLFDFERNVYEIIAWFSHRQVPLVWMLMGPLDEKIHNARIKAYERRESDMAAYMTVARQALRERGVPMIDLDRFTRTLGPMEEILADHIHFKPEIVRLQAAYVTGFLSGTL